MALSENLNFTKKKGFLEQKVLKKKNATIEMISTNCELPFTLRFLWSWIAWRNRIVSAVDYNDSQRRLENFWKTQGKFLSYTDSTLASYWLYLALCGTFFIEFYRFRHLFGKSFCHIFCTGIIFPLMNQCYVWVHGTL